MDLANIGLVVEFAGAAVMVLPDIPFIKSRLTSHDIENARRELFDTNSLTEGSEEFDQIISIVESEWDGKLKDDRSSLLIEKPQPGVARSLIVIYDDNSQGPYGDLMASVDPQSIPDEFDDMEEYIWENEKWDVICSKHVLDDWISQHVEQKTDRTLMVRGIGFLLFVLGFAVQFL